MKGSRVDWCSKRRWTQAEDSGSAARGAEKRRSLWEWRRSSSRKEPGMSLSWSHWMSAETSEGRCWRSRAAALAGSEKPSLKSLSCGWWRSSSGMGVRG